MSAGPWRSSAWTVAGPDFDSFSFIEVLSFMLFSVLRATSPSLWARTSS